MLIKSFLEYVFIAYFDMISFHHELSRNLSNIRNLLIFFYSFDISECWLWWFCDGFYGNDIPKNISSWNSCFCGNPCSDHGANANKSSDNITFSIFSCESKSCTGIETIFRWHKSSWISWSGFLRLCNDFWSIFPQRIGVDRNKTKMNPFVPKCFKKDILYES